MHSLMVSPETDFNDLESKYPIQYSMLSPLIRPLKGDLNSLLYADQSNVKLGGTNSKAHCYFVHLDGNQRPKFRVLARLLTNRVTNFCIPRSKIASALKLGYETNSTEPIDELNAVARSLFASAPKSGEGGELLLSVLAENVLGLPQLFTKMVLKTNAEMHVHGCDGVHVGVDQTSGHLNLYWGESKMYGNAADSATKCIKGLADFLLNSGGSDSRDERDLQLMRDGLDLDDPYLEEALKFYLDPQSAAYNKLSFRGLGLVAYDSEKYPTNSHQITMDDLKSAFIEEFASRLSHIEKKVMEESLSDFTLEIFLLPFQSVDSFRKFFQQELGNENE